jgi:hypothetical protein
MLTLDSKIETLYNLKMFSIKLTHEHTELVKDFCQAAASAGFENNSSIEKMKFNGTYDLSEPADFWGLVLDNKLIAVSGSHIQQDSIRCLFRSATLPEYSTLIPGISKNHMNSLPFSILLPYQIVQGLNQGIKDFYITTSNGDHDASGKMKRTHKALSLLSKRGVVDFAGDEVIYYTNQSKWKINLSNYFNALKSFHATRVQLGIDLSDDYFLLMQQGFNIA